MTLREQTEQRERETHILDMTAGTVEGIATGERFQDVPWRSAGGAGGPG